MTNSTLADIATRIELLDEPQVERSYTSAAPPQRAVATTTPAELLRYALDSGADLDRLEKLMAMQSAWEERQAQKAYNEAFAAFKSKAVRIIKNRSVTAGPLSGKKYAELFAVVNAITPALSEHGLSASWRISKDDKDWLEVTCTLKHVGGFSESVSMGGPPDAGGAKNAIQARASTISYLQRYTLKAITGLSEQDQDNDGNGSDADDDSEELAGFEDAAMGGEAELRAYYLAHKPSLAFWTKHGKSLKDCAIKAEAAKAGAMP